MPWIRCHQGALPVALLLLGGGLLGCGQKTDGPERFDVSGTVTYEGKLVPYGSIQFMPDTSQGNDGPSGFSTIVNGKYDTALQGKGTVGGPHKVVIHGEEKPDPTQPAPDDQDEPEPVVLFSDYQTEVDMPRERSTMDFDVE